MKVKYIKNKMFAQVQFEDGEIVKLNCSHLKKGKTYGAVRDDILEQEGYYRVIDESGEDYLYPCESFVKVLRKKKSKRKFI